MISVSICAWVKKCYDKDILSLNELNLEDSDEWIILGIKSNKKPKFKKRIRNLCIKAGEKLRGSQWLDETDKKLMHFLNNQILAQLQLSSLDVFQKKIEASIEKVV